MDEFFKLKTKEPNDGTSSKAASEVLSEACEELNDFIHHEIEDFDAKNTVKESNLEQAEKVDNSASTIKRSDIRDLKRSFTIDEIEDIVLEGIEKGVVTAGHLKEWQRKARNNKHFDVTMEHLKH